ncbi:MAG: CocE/NonD family hydrolase [Myxococcota bacterium]|nr:CocE/NonD family hydrolase [Myxococcota bacterium]
MRSRLGLLPILLLLLPLATACQPPSSAILSPADGAVTGTDVELSVFISVLGRPVVKLDGQRLDLSEFTENDGVYTLMLQDLAPGPHQVQVFYRVAHLDHVYASHDFEVAGQAPFTVRGSVEQVFVTHAQPDELLQLRDEHGEIVEEAPADEQGSRIFRQVPPGEGYRVTTAGSPTLTSDAVEVMSVEGSLPSPDFYSNQVLEPGYGYITMRDGTQLAVFVSLPGPPEEGPYPTVVNYSGYSPGRPGSPLSFGGIDLSFLCTDFPIFCDAPDHPSGLIAGVLGYASVGVNMRGTGCSGGAYDFFETNQYLDGYDAIEIIAAQPWVKHNKVGMVGISFPGISQLFTASTQPPSLAAITPLSVISGTETILGPGGILNDGFAVEWGSQVLDRARPYGQGWEQALVDAGDTICEENQLLHSQRVDIIQKAVENPYYTPEIYDPLNPYLFVDQIEVPVFTVGQWQDEQTGGHFPDLWDRFDSAPVFRATGLNGAHADGFAPATLDEWKNFLDFYVAREVMEIPIFIRTLVPQLFDSLFGAPVPIPDPRFLPTDDFDDALAAYEAEPEIRLLFEMGGGEGTAGPGAPEAGFEVALDSWPPPTRVGKRLYLHQDGSLRDFVPAEAESGSSWNHDPAKGQETYDVNDSFEAALPDIEWLPEIPGRQAVFATPPLTEDVTMVGFGSADLWIQSTADDADVEVLISEIRPDGLEVYVTSGWLRASQRKLRSDSTEFRPTPTRLESDLQPLPAGQWSLARVEIYPAAHVFRAGSQIRLAISTPGGNKGRWRFDVLPDPSVNSVSHSAAHPSSVLLSVIPLSVPTDLPACPGLRSQPCRIVDDTPNILLP